MKTNAIIRIIIWSMVIVLLTTLLFGVLAYGAKGSLFFTRKSEKDALTFQPSKVITPGDTVQLPASSVSELTIDWVSGSITLQPEDTDTISFYESGNSDSRYAMKWKHSGEKLVISFCQESSGLQLNKVLKKDLTVCFPKDWACDTLEVDTASTGLSVSDLSARNVSIDSASGICEFQNCSVNNLEVDTASGDIHFTGSLNTLNVNAASASFFGVLNQVPKQIEIDSMSGDLDLTLPEDAGFLVTMDGLSNRFTSDFPTKTVKGNYLCGDGACEIEMDGLSGQVTIRKAS